MSKKIRLIIFSIIVTCLLLFFPNVVQARERSIELKIEENSIFTIPYEKVLGKVKKVYISAAEDASDDKNMIIMNYHVNIYCMHKGGKLDRYDSKVKASVINKKTKIIDKNATKSIKWKLEGTTRISMDSATETSLAYIGVTNRVTGRYDTYPSSQQLLVWKMPFASGNDDLDKKAKKIKREIEDYKQYENNTNKIYFDYDTSKMTVVEDNSYYTVGPITLDYFKYTRYTGNDNNRLLYAGIGTSKITDIQYPEPGGYIYFKYDYSKTNGSDTSDESFIVYDGEGNEIPQNAWEFYYPNTRTFTKGDNASNHQAPFPGEEFYIKWCNRN